MMRYRPIVLVVWFVSLAALSCGDDDGESPLDAGSSVRGDKALSALTASDADALCAELFELVADTSTPARQCVEDALDGAETEAECNAARAACLDDEEYDDYRAYRCREFRSAPDFDCDTTVAEVRSCYDRVATWLTGLRCSQAGDAPTIPACVDELERDCSFGLSALIEAAATDAGSSDPDAAVDGGMSCEPGDTARCLCRTGGSGTQTCTASGIFGPCMCEDAGVPECSAGSESYPYDFGLGPACNSCAVANCCASYADCRGDTTCDCYWECLDRGDDDCFAPCGLGEDEYPPAFEDHAVCLSDNCATPCGLP